MSKSSYNLLIQRLDQFIRKYYLNKLIRGILYSIGFILATYILISVLEYYFYFDKGIRKGMFFGFIFSAFLALMYWILNPLSKFFSLGKTISHEQAASIIGDHFTNVKDKLLNILQLKNQTASSQINSELIEASINQKTDGLRLVPFKSAIDLSYNKKHAKYALPPFLLLLGLIFGAPSLLKDGTHRIINNDTEFEREAPFHFVLDQDNIEVLESDDLTITVRVEGTSLPDQAFIDMEDFQYELTKMDKDIYTYTFKNIQKDTYFRLYSGQFFSTEKSIKVLPKPSIDNFSLSLDYPSYTGRKDETLSNIGDAFVPQGTRIKWTYQTEDTDEVTIRFDDANINAFKQSRKNTFSHSKRMMKSEMYTIYIDNNYLTIPDSSIYNINVSPDNHPNISVESFADSTNTQVMYFIGNASDDYGLSNLSFNYTITSQTGQTKKTNRIPIPKAPSNEWTYDYVLDVREFNIQAGDQINYYFEVRDNDGVNGSKSSKTQVMSFAKPSVEQLEDEEDLNEEEVKDKVKEAIKESKKLKEEIRKMREKLLEKKELSWQEQKELEKLLEKQQEIQQKLQEAQEAFKENLEKQEEFNNPDEQIQEKQEKVEKMFEEVIDQEMQTLMEQIQELMQELNKDEMMEQLEEFEMQEEMQEMEMERLEEMFKQLEFEKEMKEMMEKLEELAEKQEDLAKDTEEKKKPNEELKKEQEKINEEFDKLKEEMEKLAEENKELEFPKPLDEEKMEEDSEEIQEELEDSKEQLEKKQNSGASKSQKKAASDMKKMAGNLQSQMESGDEEAYEEDMQALRQLLENLVTLSYDEETLIDDIKISVTNTPRYVELIQDQFKLKEDFELISDSLYALSKRVDKIESFVTEKLVETERRMEKSIDELEERKKQEASISQRRVMTNLNDLALMLSESMNEMQKQMGMSMPGNQQCNKPGGEGQGKPGAKPSDKISEGQKGLGEKIQEMMEKQGKEGNSAKDFAEAAAKQAALRKALEDAKRKSQEQGKGGQGYEEILDLMNKIEEDLVNKRLNNDLLKRQQDIETRLLQADKADRKREKDNKRKGETADQIVRELPPNLQEYLKEKESEVELFKKVSPDVYPLYQKMIEGYYDALKSNNN